MNLKVNIPVKMVLVKSNIIGCCNYHRLPDIAIDAEKKRLMLDLVIEAVNKFPGHLFTIVERPVQTIKSDESILEHKRISIDLLVYEATT